MRLRRWLPRAIAVSCLLAALLSAPGLAGVESAPGDPRRLDITGPGGSAAKTREACITVRRPPR